MLCVFYHNTQTNQFSGTKTANDARPCTSFRWTIQGSRWGSNQRKTVSGKDSQGRKNFRQLSRIWIVPGEAEKQPWGEVSIYRGHSWAKTQRWGSQKRGGQTAARAVLNPHVSSECWAAPCLNVSPCFLDLLVQQLHLLRQIYLYYCQRAACCGPCFSINVLVEGLQKQRNGD